MLNWYFAPCGFATYEICVGYNILNVPGSLLMLVSTQNKIRICYKQIIELLQLKFYFAIKLKFCCCK